MIASNAAISLPAKISNFNCAAAALSFADSAIIFSIFNCSSFCFFSASAIAACRAACALVAFTLAFVIS